MHFRHKPLIEQFDILQDGKMRPYYRYQVPQNNYQAGRFGHRSHTVLSKDNFIISDTQISGEFSVEKQEQKNGRFESRFQILASGVKSSNRGVNDFSNLARLFMLPTKDVRLLLNKNGRIDRVLNKEAVFSLWEEVYHFLASELTNEALLKSIKQKGDNEFGRVDESIRRIELYTLFFMPVFNIKYTPGKKYNCPLVLASQLLPKEVVELDLHEKDIRAEQDHLHFTFEGETSDTGLLKKAKGIYGKLLDEKAEHCLKLELSYHLNATTGYPVSIDLFSKETLGNFLCSEQITEIYIIEEPVLPTYKPAPASSPDSDPKTNVPEEPKTKNFHSWILDDDSFV